MRLSNFKVPEGLSAQTVQIYRELGTRMINQFKATGNEAGMALHNARIKLLDMIK